MKTLVAFMKKDWLEQIRAGRITLLIIIFVLLGIMNPATAKLTPWLLEMMAESLEASGMTVTTTTITALDSWMQFFKNAPMGLMAFILLQSWIFTKEYQSGTLVLSLTKGLERYKVVVSKAVVLAVLWTVLYYLSFGITYAYNAYYWDNSIAQNLMFSVLCWWVLGMWIIGLTVLFSTIAKNNIGVLGGVGGVTVLSYLLGLIPKISKYTPTFLADGNSLVYGMKDVSDYIPALVIASVTCALAFAVSIPVFNKKHI